MKILIVHHSAADATQISSQVIQAHPETTSINDVNHLASSLSEMQPEVVLLDVDLAEQVAASQLLALDPNEPDAPTVVLLFNGVNQDRVEHFVQSNPVETLSLPVPQSVLLQRLQQIEQLRAYNAIKTERDLLHRTYKLDLVYMDRNGVIYQINEQQIGRLGGYEVDDLMGKNIRNFIEPQSWHQAKYHFLKTLRGNTEIFDSRLIRKHGDIIDISVRNQPVWENDEIVGVSCVIRNITDRKNLEREIEEARYKFELLFENAGDAILVVDFDTARILDANRRAVQLFNFSKEAFRRKNLVDLWADIPAQQFEVYLKQIRSSKTLTIEDQLFTRKDGKTVPVDLSTAIFTHKNDYILHIIIKDISEKKNVEQMKQDLTAMIVHDLKNPLSSIMMSVDFFTAFPDQEIDDTQKQNLDLIRFNSEMLLQMINDMLDIQKIESGNLKLKKAEENIYSLINEAITQLNFIRRAAGVEISYDFEDNLPPLNLDRELILRVITNILSNAIKFTPSHGWIKIRLKEASSDWVQASISDSGEGIPPEYLDRIFDKFIQVETRRSGHKLSTGLGLTFCKMAVEAHGGKIWAESKLGTGSTFHFTLPVANHVALTETPVMAHAVPH